ICLVNCAVFPFVPRVSVCSYFIPSSTVRVPFMHIVGKFHGVPSDRRDTASQYQLIPISVKFGTVTYNSSIAWCRNLACITVYVLRKCGRGTAYSQYQGHKDA